MQDVALSEWRISHGIEMDKITDKIKSVRQTLGRAYTRPDPKKVDELVESLQDNQTALDYLKVTRGLADETIEHFKLGYDSGRDAIAIPIFKNNELINVKYRFLNPDKIRYTSERGAETWLYNEEGIEIGKKKGGVLVVEGEIDLMSCWQAGIKNVVTPASGKDSYGVWLELLDAVPKVYVAFDNDDGGKQTNIKFADRVGVEKSFEVKYPEGIKDANEFFKTHGKEDYIELIRKATPFYSYEFKNVGDVIQQLRDSEDSELELKWIPNVKIEKDWLIVLSGKSNVGKTTYAMNVAQELSDRGVPVLVMPFERGIASVGKRLLQVVFNKTLEDFKYTSKDEWEDILVRSIDMPIYFALPKKNEIVETVKKSKRLFDTRVVIIDHLDYIIRHVGGNKESEIANTLQDLKRIGEENGIIFIVVTHIRKIDGLGADKGRRPSLEDLKGSSSLYQDPECVLLLCSEQEGTIIVDVAKNKGTMGAYKFGIREETGQMNTDVDPDPEEF